MALSRAGVWSSWSRAALLPLAIGIGGCSGAAPVSTPAREPVLLLDIEATPGRLDPALAAAMTAHVSRVVAASETYRVIAGEELRVALRAQKSPPRRKRHGARGRGGACGDLQCQARAGQSLGAVAAIVLRVERNLLGECDVFAELRDLRRVAVEGRARARRGCAGEELKDSLHDVLCHVLARRGTLRRSIDAGAPASPGAPDPELFTDCLARGDFYWAEHRLDEFRRARVDRSPDQLAVQEQRMGEQVLALKRLYDGVGQHRRARWTLAAQCRTGAIYEAFAARLLEGYRTEGAAGAELTAAAREKTRPLEDKAREIYAGCVKRGELLKISCPELEEARRRAGAR